MTHVGRDPLALSARRRTTRWRFGCAFVAAAASFGVMGCASNDIYPASELPAPLQAAHIENPKTLELIRLANGTYNNELIAADDVLEVNILAGLNPKDNPPTMQPRVSKNGLITLPEVGDVNVAGLDLESTESAIATACVQRQIYRRPHVTVSMKRQATNRVMVFGAVKNPGYHNLPRGASDILSAIVAAGSLADDAGTNVEVRNPSGGSVIPDRIAQGLGPSGDVTNVGHSQSAPARMRTGPSSFKIDLVSATKSGQAAAPLADGSIVTVERRDPESIQVTGLVNKPGEIKYPIGTELRLLDAISQAGWTNNQGANKVYIIRSTPRQIVIEASLREAKRNPNENIRLAPGDVVSVEQTPTTVMIDTLKLIRFAVGTSLNTLF
ncbi:MAG: polysaccharide biosynthesis/export family protein [Planctomycetaceae bacterium]|nr:polysaccharide biosynthesis/export family protein [Planctomycetaceae bacterium]